MSSPEYSGQEHWTERERAAFRALMRDVETYRQEYWNDLSTEQQNDRWRWVLSILEDYLPIIMISSTNRERAVLILDQQMLPFCSHGRDALAVDGLSGELARLHPSNAMPLEQGAHRSGDLVNGVALGHLPRPQAGRVRPR